jgi:hypothetical protein
LETTLQVFFQTEIKLSVVEGGGKIEDFEMFALDYDSDRHFSYQYFRNKYDVTKNYPLLIVGSRFQDLKFGLQIDRRVLMCSIT